MVYRRPKTWRDHVRDYWPEASEDICNEILWAHTSHPFAGPAELLEQLDDYMVNVLGRTKIAQNEELEPLSYWHDLVRLYLPDANIEYVREVLDNHTGWPDVANSIITKQIHEHMQGMGYKRRSDGKD